MSVINADLVRQYVAEGRADLLITWLETLTDERNRAELQSRARLRELEILTQATQDLTRDIGASAGFGRQKPKGGEPKPTPKAKTSPSAALDLDL